MSDAAQIFSQYLNAFARGDSETAAGLIDDDFKFHGPLLQSEGKADFLEGAAKLGPIMRGAEMLRQFGDGDEVCSIYDFKIETPKGKGTVTMSEWSRVRNGKLVSSRLLFDTAAFMALMPAPQ